MQLFLQVVLAYPTLPLSIVLTVCLLYWLLVAGGLLGDGRCGRASLWLLREQFKRQGGIALEPRTGNKGRKSLPIGNAHIHLAVNTRHARQGLGQSQWQGKWPGQGRGQGYRYLPGTGKAKHIAL